MTIDSFAKKYQGKILENSTEMKLFISDLMGALSQYCREFGMSIISWRREGSSISGNIAWYGDRVFFHYDLPKYGKPIELMAGETKERIIYYKTPDLVFPYRTFYDEFVPRAYRLMALGA